MMALLQKHVIKKIWVSLAILAWMGSLGFMLSRCGSGSDSGTSNLAGSSSTNTARSSSTKTDSTSSTNTDSTSSTSTGTSTTISSSLPSITKGWSTILSSAGTVVSDKNGGASNGKTSGPFSLFFLGDDTGWTAGNLGEILYTTDGGSSATLLKSPTSGVLRKIMALSSNEIWIAGSDSTNNGYSIWTSTDAGSTWSLETNTKTQFPDRSFSYDDRFQSFVMTSTRQIFVAGSITGSGAIIIGRSSSGTWSTLYNQNSASDRLYSIAFVADDSTKLLAVGTKGAILSSSDSGVTWKLKTSNTTETLFDVTCAKQTCLTVGSGGTILKSKDSGDTWTALNGGTTVDLVVAFMTTDGLIWVGGDVTSDSGNATILYSADGGTTWNAQTTSAACIIQDIGMLSDKVGWAACANTASNTGALLYTNNSGN